MRSAALMSSALFVRLKRAKLALRFALLLAFIESLAKAHRGFGEFYILFLKIFQFFYSKFIESLFLF